MLKSNESVRIDIDLERYETTLTILFATDEHEGFYQCHATNEMNENVTRAKFNLCSTSNKTTTTTTTTSKTTSTSHSEHLAKMNMEKSKRARKIIRRKVEPSSAATVIVVQPVVTAVETKMTIPQTKTTTTTSSSSTSSATQKTVQITTQTNVTEEENIEIHEEIEEIRVKIYKECVSAQDLANFKMADEVNEVLNFIEAHKFGSGELPLRELATIGYLVQRGITVTEITHLYNADSFPALRNPQSQAALVQLVEREGHGRMISEVLTEETIIDDEHMFASTVGFRAFMRMIQEQHITIEEVIANFKEEDFVSQEWQYGEIRERCRTMSSERSSMGSREVLSTGKAVF